MYKRILTSVIAGLCVMTAVADEKVPQKNEKELVVEAENKVDLTYEDLKLGDVKHLKLIADYGKLTPRNKNEEKPNDVLYTTFKDYYDILLKSGQLSEKDRIAFAKLDLDIKVIEMKNQMYRENKRALFIDTTKEEINTECFNRVYYNFKTCFDYGFGKVYSIQNTEERDSPKQAENEADKIIEELKSRGFKKDSGFYVKGDLKYELKTNGTTLETFMTKTSLENDKKLRLKELKELRYKKTIQDHLKYLEQ
jgi:hypothetical protein